MMGNISSRKEHLIDIYHTHLNSHERVPLSPTFDVVNLIQGQFVLIKLLKLQFQLVILNY